MAITNYLVHFLTEDTYNSKKSELRNDAVAFVKDATIIHTHGTDYYCGSGPVALKSDIPEVFKIPMNEFSGSSGTITSFTFSELYQKIESGTQIVLEAIVDGNIYNYTPLALVAMSNDQIKLQLITSNNIRFITFYSNNNYIVQSISIPTKLSDFNIRATATELNYVDGVTSNIQTQLNGKAASSHTHSNYVPTSRTVNGKALSANITLTASDVSAAASSHTHTTSQVSGLADVATSGSYNDLSDKPSIPSLAGYATQSWVNTQLAGYLPLTGGTLTGGTLFLKEQGAGIFYVESMGISIKSTNNGDDTISIMGGGIALQLISPSNFTIDGNQILTENNWNEYITATDTKNTTGTSNSTSKLYLAGGTSQSSTGVVTYSNSNVYTQNGYLYASMMNATNGFYETSDARLKDFQGDIKALEIVSEIPTKYFVWKSDEKQEQHIGTSAQEIQKIYPDLVTSDEDGILSVDYARLSIVALAAIKELNKQVIDLKEEIKQLKSN